MSTPEQKSARVERRANETPVSPEQQRADRQADREAVLALQREKHAAELAARIAQAREQLAFRRERWAAEHEKSKAAIMAQLEARDRSQKLAFDNAEAKLRIQELEAKLAEKGNGQ